MPFNGPYGPPSPVKPAKVILLSFAAVIAIGTVLLLLPQATQPGLETTFSTALFTATSAVCVTGLIVVDTATHWTPFGQIAIMLLIQIGGLGVMTMSTGVVLALRRKVTLKQRMIIREAMGGLSLQGMVRLIRNVLIIAASFQLLGWALFTWRLASDYPIGRALYLGLFHSISAFNNAGFDLFSVSLESYVTDPVMNFTAILLIIAGGLGFIVMIDLFHFWRVRQRLSLHTRVVLITTVILLLGGFVVILASEFGNPETLGTLKLPGKLLAAWFTAVTPRTAGFNTLPTGSLQTASLFLIILLMFVGGSPGSTAGGIKTTTLATVMLTVRSALIGKDDIQFLGRRLSRHIVDHSITIIVLAAALVFVVTLGLVFFEGAPFLECLFEATSAFGTVGLTMGMTPNLSLPGRLLLTLTMFAGRLGPLTLAVGLILGREDRAHYRLPQEDIIIG